MFSKQKRLYFVCLVFCFTLFNFSKCLDDYHNGLDDFFDGRGNLFNGRLLLDWAKNSQSKDISMKDNSRCDEDLLDLADSYKNLELWAVEMIDAAGKEPYGLITGNWNSFGHKEQCLDIRHKKQNRQLKGKYCTAQIPLPRIIQKLIIDKYGFRPPNKTETNTVIAPRFINNVNKTFVFHLGLCVPDSCSAEYLQSMVQTKWEEFELSEGQALVPARLCEVGDDVQPWEPLEIVTITFFACFGAMVLLSTAYDVWFLYYRKDDGSTDKHVVKRSFSLHTNYKTLVTLREPGSLGCLDGIRAISILWIILGHRYNHRQYMAHENYFELYTWAATFQSMPIASAVQGVDTFFVLSGILLSYVVFRVKSAKLFLKGIPLFYFHRYIRLTPVVAIVIFLYAGISGRMFVGPLKEFMTRVMQDNCRINWWTDLLYVQNFVDTDRICVSQTWYLSIDTQLYFLSPLVILPMLWKPKVGIAWLVLLILISQAVTTYIAYDGGWWGGMLLIGDPNDATFRSLFYVPTYTRATPYLLGILAGYFLKNHLDGKKGKPVEPLTPQQIKVRRIINTVGWILSLVIMGAVIFGMQPLQRLDHVYDPWQDVTFLGFSKTAWSLALIYVVYACALGYGGPVNWILTLKPLQLIAKISYSLYLIHKLFQSIQISHITHVSNFDHFTMIYEFFGDIFIGSIAAAIMTMVFELPVDILKKKYLPVPRAKPKIAESKADA